MAKPNTQRRRRSKFSTSNVVPWIVGKKVGPPRFGDLEGSVLVRDKLTSICPRLGRGGSIFKFKSGDEDVTWWRSRALRTSICGSTCRLSSRAAGYVGVLPEDPALAPFSMQWSSLARTTQQYYNSVVATICKNKKTASNQPSQSGPITGIWFAGSRAGQFTAASHRANRHLRHIVAYRSQSQ